VDSDPILVQLAISIPITLGLVVYTLMRRDDSTLHSLLSALLASLAVWLIATALRIVGDSHTIQVLALHAELTSLMVMPPLFVVTMGYFARSPAFEQSRAASIAIFTVFALFGLAYWTDGWHHLFFSNREAKLAGLPPNAWGGPLYWGLQVWCAIADAGAIALCFTALWRGRNEAERRRATMVILAIAAPIAAHFLFLLGWTGLEYSLAPGTIGATAILFVVGVHRYGLLEGQAIVRHDVIEHIDDGLLLADRQGIVLDANISAELAFGRLRAELRGQTIAEAFALIEPEGERESLGSRIASLPLDGGRLSGEIRTTDGRWLEVTAGAVVAVGSQPAGRFVSLTDRSIQRRNELLLRERQKLESVGILAAGIAHEVNNPLAYVRSNLSHLKSLAGEIEKHVDPDDSDCASDLLEFPAVLGESLDGLDRISRIVESMLRFSRVSDENLCSLCLNDVVEEAIRLAALERSTGIQVERSLMDDLPSIMGSPERLVQVLLNLLLNARQALSDRDGARIEVETCVEGGRALVRVRDNGPGIDEEVRDRIFDPFFTTRPPNEGTGLGLAIAFDIVREHRGKLALESELGVGTCFTTSFPVNPADAADAP